MFQGAFGAASDGVGEEVDVFEPDEAPPPEHRDGLQRFAELIDRRLHLGDVAGEATDGFTGELVVDLLSQLVEALTSHPADEEVVGAADKNERFGISHGAL